MAIRTRRTISDCYNDFNLEIKRLQKFDNDNNLNFNNGGLSLNQIELMTEAIFFAGFRAYEGFIRELFILYCLGEQPLNPTTTPPISYINPNDFPHAESMIKSSLKFIEWNSPDELILRSETFLRNGHPIKIAYTTHKQDLDKFKKLRNHIAHNSSESEDQYIKVIREYNNGVIPAIIPSVGQYLRLSCKKKSSKTKYILLDFFDTMLHISKTIT